MVIRLDQVPGSNSFGSMTERLSCLRLSFSKDMDIFPSMTRRVKYYIRETPTIIAITRQIIRNLGSFDLLSKPFIYEN